MRASSTRLLRPRPRSCERLQGWSAASLANLMNEAAILTVRRSLPNITLPLMLELIESINWGSRAPKIPPSEAKNRCGLSGPPLHRVLDTLAVCGWARFLVSIQLGPAGRCAMQLGPAAALLCGA